MSTRSQRPQRPQRPINPSIDAERMQALLEEKKQKRAEIQEKRTLRKAESAKRKVTHNAILESAQNKENGWGSTNRRGQDRGSSKRLLGASGKSLQTPEMPAGPEEPLNGNTDAVMAVTQTAVLVETGEVGDGGEEGGESGAEGKKEGHEGEREGEADGEGRREGEEGKRRREEETGEAEGMGGEEVGDGMGGGNGDTTEVVPVGEAEAQEQSSCNIEPTTTTATTMEFQKPKSKSPPEPAKMVKLPSALLPDSKPITRMETDFRDADELNMTIPTMEKLPSNTQSTVMEDPVENVEPDEEMEFHYFDYTQKDLLSSGHYSKLARLDKEDVRMIAKIALTKSEQHEELKASHRWMVNYDMRYSMVRNYRIRREAEALQRLSHSCIPKVIETLIDPENYATHLILEFMEGAPVMRDQTYSAPLSEGLVQRVFVQAVNVVAFCHSEGVAHGNIKPSNFLVTGSGAETHVNLVDFSCSRLFDPPVQGASEDACNDTRDSVDEHGVKFGSRMFQCPQVQQGLNYSLRAADVWALGVSLYYMLIGQLPFTAEETLEHGPNNYKLKFPAKRKLSDDAKDLIKRMLAVREDRRLSMSGVKGHPWMLADHTDIVQPLAAPSLKPPKGGILHRKVTKLMRSRGAVNESA